ncbi:MAG: ribosome biogenesis GTPase Der [Stellaceae bacterium]|jgi:GTP-binding protein
MALAVAIIGRPNVGKSTLFNRLAGRKTALVASEPGLTRDRREGLAQLADLELRITDTAGFEQSKGRDLAARMRVQTERAVAEADVALFLVDAREGVTALDRDLAQWLRRLGKPVVLVANKTEGRGTQSGIAEAYGLGLGEPVAISAEHGEGLADLYEALLPYAVKSEEKPSEPDAVPGDAERPLQLTVVGRPNVGKSTLINRLLGAERLLTGPEPGITRDAISIDWSWRGRKLRLIDTAGLRRKSRIEAKTERLSAGDTLHAIRFAEVAVLVVDASLGLERQDLAIARMVAEEGRALVLAVNKWDLVTKRKETLEKITERMAQSLPQLAGLKPLTLSAATGAGMDKLVPAAFDAYAAWNRRVPTPTLNRFLVRVQERNPPPLVAGRRLKLRYMTQVNIRPPTFALFASKPGELPESWRRYLVNLLRESFDLPGVPIRMMLRKGKNPFADAR